MRGIASLALASALAGCNPGENYSTYGWIKLDNGEQVRTSYSAFFGNSVSLKIRRLDGAEVTYENDYTDFWKEDFLDKVKLRKVSIKSKDKEIEFFGYCKMYANATEIARQQYTNYLSRIEFEKSQKALEAIIEVGR